MVINKTSNSDIMIFNTTGGGGGATMDDDRGLSDGDENVCFNLSYSSASSGPGEAVNKKAKRRSNHGTWRWDGEEPLVLVQN